MNKQETLNHLHELGLVAVIRGPSPDLTVRMVEALVAGGVTGIEITYTTPNAPEVVRRLDRTFGELILLGMGTLTDPAQAAEAQDAGARYLVSPVTDEALGRAMVATGLPVMIGALTPTEVYKAHQLDSDVVKLFPGSAVGPDYVKALHGPFPQIKIMPTGGVDEHNVGEWFKAGVFAVGAGSQLSPGKLAKEGRFEEITAIARRFAAAVRAAREQ
jgi:2-dehydro-3-deoxyphosphogluconate aldolase / (4S)-4-hydroxy-2-oxoglutarate aldolase